MFDDIYIKLTCNLQNICEDPTADTVDEVKRRIKIALCEAEVMEDQLMEDMRQESLDDEDFIVKGEE